jgi:hypothetical protein
VIGLIPVLGCVMIQDYPFDATFTIDSVCGGSNPETCKVSCIGFGGIRC